MAAIGTAAGQGKRPDKPSGSTSNPTTSSLRITINETYFGKTGSAVFVITSSPAGSTNPQTTPSISTSGSTYTFTGLSSSTTYNFTMFARTPYGVDSLVSNSFSGTTSAPPPPPPPIIATPPPIIATPPPIIATPPPIIATPPPIIATPPPCPPCRPACGFIGPYPSFCSCGICIY